MIAATVFRHRNKLHVVFICSLPPTLTKSILIHGTVALKLSSTVVIAFPLLLFLFLGTYNSLFVVVLVSLSIRADGIDPLTNSNNNVIVARDNDLSLLLLASKFSAPPESMQHICAAQFAPLKNLL